MSWAERLQKRINEPRATCLPAPREELNGLLNEAINMAVKLIEQHGNHIPFCFAITFAGERTDIAADDTKIRDPDLLFESVRQRTLESIRTLRLRAVALARNVRFHRPTDPEPRDAVQVTLDHLSDSARTCYLPYRVVDGRVVADELFATDPVERLIADKATFIAGSAGEVKGR